MTNLWLKTATEMEIPMWMSSSVAQRRQTLSVEFTDVITRPASGSPFFCKYCTHTLKFDHITCTASSSDESAMSRSRADEEIGRSKSLVWCKMSANKNWLTSVGRQYRKTFIGRCVIGFILDLAPGTLSLE